jgi:hypothetical protein
MRILESAVLIQVIKPANGGRYGREADCAGQTKQTVPQFLDCNACFAGPPGMAVNRALGTQGRGSGQLHELTGRVAQGPELPDCLSQMLYGFDVLGMVFLQASVMPGYLCHSVIHPAAETAAG